MTDRHTDILELLARQSRRRLESHDALPETPDAGSAQRRRSLEEMAQRTLARVTAARARRRQVPGG